MINGSIFGMMMSNSEPKVAKILESTGEKNPAEAFRKRFARTIMTMLSWYESDLVPGSSSWKSLEFARKMHYRVSKQTNAIGLGIISMADVAFACFGFMG